MIKLSGEAFGDGDGRGINTEAVEKIASKILQVKRQGVQIAVVNGGGNIWRQRDHQDANIGRIDSDYMGMIATVMNAVALAAALRQEGASCRIMSSFPVPQVAEPYLAHQAEEALGAGEIVICAGGMGNPYFSTDTAAALRAAELNCEVILKATRVDGVYSADPEKDPEAVRYDSLTYDEALQKKLRIMDQTAFSLCRENGLKVVVFDMNEESALLNAARGEKVGTHIF